MKTSTQLKALVRNLSKAKNVEAEIILRSFMLERFLERVSVSDYKESFILKGGMLIAAMVGIDTRTTMDMDATKKGKRSRNQRFLYSSKIYCVSRLTTESLLHCAELRKYGKRRIIPATALPSKLFLIKHARPSKSTLPRENL